MGSEAPRLVRPTVFPTLFSLAEILVLAGTAGAGRMALPASTRIATRLKSVQGPSSFSPPWNVLNMLRDPCMSSGAVRDLCRALPRLPPAGPARATGERHTRVAFYIKMMYRVCSFDRHFHGIRSRQARLGVPPS